MYSPTPAEAARSLDLGFTPGSSTGRYDPSAPWVWTARMLSLCPSAAVTEASLNVSLPPPKTPRIFFPGTPPMTPVTAAPLAITTTSPSRRSSLTVKRKGRPSSAVSGMSSASMILKGVPSLIVTTAPGEVLELPDGDGLGCEGGTGVLAAELAADAGDG